MLKFRYPGVKSFSADEKDIFYGREDDIQKLVKLINLKKSTLIYSKSGYGKSSLIQAGIIPILEQNSFIFQIRFQSYINSNQSNTPLQTLKSALFLIQKSCLNKILKKEKTLWYYLKNRHLYNSDKNLTTKFIIIFDQFEELFTYPEDQIFEFAYEFYEIMTNSIPQSYINGFEQKIKENPTFLTKEELDFFYKELDLKVIFSIRSDKMSFINRLKPFIPNIFSNIYELLPLTISQAEEAILNPIYKEGNFISPRFDYENEALEMILNYLTKTNINQIETFQVQILCQFCENLVIENKKLLKTNNGFPIIKKENLGNIEEIYENFYVTLINKFHKFHRKAIKLLIEDNLIVNEERVSLPDKTILNFEGINEKILNELVDSHIIRGQENSVGGTSYELAHDTLIAPIVKERNKRLELAKHIFEIEKDKEDKLRRAEKTMLITIIISVFVLVIGIFMMYEIFKNEKYKISNEYQDKIEIKKTKIKSLDSLLDIKTKEYEIELNINNEIIDRLSQNEKNKLNKKFLELAKEIYKNKRNYETAKLYLETCIKLKAENEDAKKLLDSLNSLN